MNGLCVCCGVTGLVERHHVGGRAHSDVLTDVCVPCHRILSAWQTERTWPGDSSPPVRVALEALDAVALLLRRRRGGRDALTDLVSMLSRAVLGYARVEVRPLAGDPLTVPPVTPDRLWEKDRFDALARLVADVRVVIGMADVDLVPRLEGDDLYRVASSRLILPLLKRSVAGLLVAVRESPIGGTDFGLSLGTVAEVFRHSTSTFRDAIAFRGVL